MSFIDLKKVYPICQSPPSTIMEAPHEYRENDFRPADGLCHPLRVSEMRRTLRRQPQGDQFFLLGSIPLHGLRPAHVPRKPARHSSLPSGGSIEVIPSGHPREGLPQYPRPCQSEQGLANLRRFCSCSHRQSQKTLCPGFLRCRTGSDGVCTGFNHNQSVPGTVPLGGIPQAQGRGEAPHASGSSREHPNRGHHHHGKGTRCEHPRRSELRGRIHLHYGSRVSRLWASLRNTPKLGVLCHTGEEKLRRKTSLLPPRGQIHRRSMRPDRHPQGLLRETGLPGETPSHPILRFKERQTPCIPYQQFFSAGGDDRRTLSQSLAGGAVFQVDQAAPPDQGILWYHRKRRQDPDMDRNLRLCSGGDREKDLESGPQSLHNSTGFERDSFRENAYFTSTYEYTLRKQGEPPQQPVVFIRLTLGQ